MCSQLVNLLWLWGLHILLMLLALHLRQDLSKTRGEMQIKGLPPYAAPGKVPDLSCLTHNGPLLG